MESQDQSGMDIDSEPTTIQSQLEHDQIQIPSDPEQIQISSDIGSNIHVNTNPIPMPSSPPQSAPSYRTLIQSTPIRPTAPTQESPRKRKAQSILERLPSGKTLIQKARDLLIQAAHEEKDSQKQTNLIDLIQVFQEYTEGRTNPTTKASRILARQLGDLEKLKRQLERAQAPLVLSNPRHQPQETQQNLQKLYAQVASQSGQTIQPIQLQEPFQLVTNQPKAQKAQRIQEKTNFRERRLILIQSIKNPDIDSKTIRDNINKAFQQKGFKTPVVTSATKSKQGGNIVLTTTEEYSGNFLRLKKEVWQHTAPFRSLEVDTPWFKVVAHGIPTRDFNKEGGLILLQDEVEIFNKGLKLVCTPRWLSSPQKRSQNLRGSVILSFATEEEGRIALKGRLYIAGISVRTEKLVETSPSYQCRNCQQFGHTPIRCRNTPKCEFCAEDHPSNQHKCSLCIEVHPCQHTTKKCVNCHENHTSADRTCKTYQDIQQKTSSRNRSYE